MKKLINKKGFTLVELLAVIVVLAIVMTLAVAGISRVIDDARKNSFVSDALMFLDGAHQLVTSDNVSSLFGDDAGSGYAPSCKDSTNDTTVIPLLAINLDQGGVKSPWGNKYNKGSKVEQGTKDGSYIQVTSVIDNGSCKFEYAIYLTDDVHHIGTADGPIAESEVNNTKIQTGSGS